MAATSAETLPTLAVNRIDRCLHSGQNLQHVKSAVMAQHQQRFVALMTPQRQTASHYMQVIHILNLIMKLRPELKGT